MGFILMQPANKFLPKTSGAFSNRWRERWRKVGAVHLNRLRAIEVNRPYLLPKRRPLDEFHTLDNEKIKHDGSCTTW